MAELTYSTELFAGALIYFAEYASGTSDTATKPASNNAAWKELACVESFKPKSVKVTEKAMVPCATGWEEQKREFTVADLFEATTRKTTEVFQRLQMGLAGAITAGTAQTPFVTSDRKVSGWCKVQLRQHIGTDRYVLDFYADLRIAGDPPAAEAGTQKPNMEFYVRRDTTLNAFNIPS
jgi:hypothetical protein